MEALPPLVAVFIVVGILSAILTTADSLLHAMVTIIQQDVYKESYLRNLRGKGDDYLARDNIDKRATRVGQVGAVFISAGAVFVGIERPPSLFMLTQIGIAGFLSGATIPVLFGYFWKGTTKRGAEAAFSAGFLTYCVLFFDIPSTGIAPENQFLAFAVATATSVIAAVVVSTMTEASVEEQQAIAFDRTTDTVHGDD
jgi:sodium/proline symporter